MVSAGETSMPISTNSSHQNAYISSTSLNLFNTVTPVSDWSEGDVKEWLQSVGFADLAQVSEEHGIDGAVLIHLDFESLKDLGFVKVGQRLRLMRLINELLGASEDFGSSTEQTHFESNNVWNTVHNQNDRIRTLESQVWTLQQTTQSLRERTDSLSSFNTSWTMQSCSDLLALQSSKPSADSGNSTPPTTASPIRTAVTSKLHDAYNFCNYTHSPCEVPSNHHNPRSVEQSARALDGLNFTPPSKLSQVQTGRSSTSPEGPSNASYRDAELFPSISKTPQAMKSPKHAALLPPFPQNSDFLPGSSQERFHSTPEPRRKYSASKPDDIIVEGTISRPTSAQVKPTSVGGNGFVVGRKPSLLTRRVGGPSQGIGSRSMRSGGASNENRTAVVCKRSSSSTVLSSLQDDLKPYSPSKVEKKPSSPTAINRSASTSNLKAVNGSDLRLGSRSKQLNSQTSVKVKSNNEQTVIEVLSNHLSTFYVNEPHAWSKHVLLLRMNDIKEYCLSYDEIPLKVYRSFKSREGIDFAIRPIEDIPSPLRVAGNNRKKNPTFALEDELAPPDESKSSNEETKKAEAERKPLACGLALCGYQAENPDELNIKAGELFKLKSRFKGRYLLERESNFLSSSPLSAVGVTSWTPSPSPTRVANVAHNDHAGWVPESCVMEISRSMRTLNSKGSSLKHLISSPLENSDELLDLENLTTNKICLISFQSQFITWSGELSKVVQGEKIRAFNHKTRFHWVYCLRESNGERGWLPKWILSSNLKVLPESKYSDPQDKLQTYLLQQSSNHLRNSIARPHDHSSNRNAALLGRSSSSASALKKAGIHKSRLSPTSLHSVWGSNIQKLGHGNVAESPVQASSQSTNRTSPDGTHEASNPSTRLNRSVDGGRSSNFTPRSLRSRINSTVAS